MSLVGFLLLIMTFLSMAASYVISYVMSYFSFDIQTFVANAMSGIFGLSKVQSITAAKNILASGAFSDIISMLKTCIFMVLPAYLFSKAVGLSQDETFCTKGKYVKGKVSLFALCLLCMMSLTMFSDSVFSFLFPKALPDVSTSTIAVSNDVFSNITAFLYTCIFVPVVEEYIFRGVIFTSLRKYGLVFATVSSAICFGIMHASPTQTMYAIIFGIFSCIFVAVSGNIKTSVLFHAINNFTIFAQSFLEGYLTKEAFDVYYTIYIAVMCVFAFFGILKLLEKDGVYSTFQELSDSDNDRFENMPGLKQFFTPTILVFLCYYVQSILSGVTL